MHWIKASAKVDARKIYSKTTKKIFSRIILQKKDVMKHIEIMQKNLECTAKQQGELITYLQLLKKLHSLRCKIKNNRVEDQALFR